MKQESETIEHKLDGRENESFEYKNSSSLLVPLSLVNPKYICKIKIPLSETIGFGNNEKLSLPKVKNRIGGLYAGNLNIYEARFFLHANFEIQKNGKSYISIPDFANFVSFPNFSITRKGYNYGEAKYYK